MLLNSSRCSTLNCSCSKQIFQWCAARTYQFTSQKMYFGDLWPFKCRLNSSSGRRGVAGGVGEYVKICEVQVGAVVWCETGIFKPTAIHIQIARQLLIQHRSRVWCLVLGDVPQTCLVWRWIVGWKQFFQLFRAFWSHLSVCFWPACTRFYPHFCELLLWDEEGVWVLL